MIAVIAEELFDRQPEAYRRAANWRPTPYYDLTVVSSGTRRSGPCATEPLTDEYSMTSDCGW